MAISSLFMGTEPANKERTIDEDKSAICWNLRRELFASIQATPMISYLNLKWYFVSELKSLQRLEVVPALRVKSSRDKNWGVDLTTDLIHLSF